MSTVNVEVNGRVYAIGCEDGQEVHVQGLAAQFDSQVREVAEAVGQVGELRLFLMAALLTADELADLKNRFSHLQGELARAQSEAAIVEARAARALEQAAERIEAISVEHEADSPRA
jgi:cell division protein ZapA